jgi:hypothetical protein
MDGLVGDCELVGVDGLYYFLLLPRLVVHVSFVALRCSDSAVAQMAALFARKESNHPFKKKKKTPSADG